MVWRRRLEDMVSTRKWMWMKGSRRLKTRWWIRQDTRVGAAAEGIRLYIRWQCPRRWSGHHELPQMPKSGPLTFGVSNLHFLRSRRILLLQGVTAAHLPEQLSALSIQSDLLAIYLCPRRACQSTRHQRLRPPSGGRTPATPTSRL